MYFELSLVLCIVLQAESDKPYKLLGPNQGPISPPYQVACKLKRENLLGKPGIAESATRQSSDESANIQQPRVDDSMTDQLSPAKSGNTDSAS